MTRFSSACYLRAEVPSWAQPYNFQLYSSGKFLDKFLISFKKNNSILSKVPLLDTDLIIYYRVKYIVKLSNSKDVSAIRPPEVVYKIPKLIDNLFR